MRKKNYKTSFFKKVFTKRKQGLSLTKAASRKKQVKMRKNFLLRLIISILLWNSVFFIIYFLDPSLFGAIPAFFLLLFLALLLTLSLVFENPRRAFRLSLALTFFLILRYLGVGNLLNLLLIAGFVLALEISLSGT